MAYGKAVYLWQWNGVMERSYDEMAATLARGGVDEIRQKCAHWLTWTGKPRPGNYDTSPLSMKSIADVERCRDAFALKGIRCYPWVCPMGLDPEDEATLHAEIARANGRLDLDVEPGDEFWPALNSHDYSAVVPYFKTLRDLVGTDVELTIDFPGSWAWSYITPLLRAAAPYVDRYACQSYFGTTIAQRDQGLFDAIGTGKPLDHVSDVVHLPAMIDRASHTAANRLIVWDAAHMNGAAYAALAALHLPGDGAASPDPWDGYVFGGRAIPDAMSADHDTPATGEQPVPPNTVYAVGKSGRHYIYDPLLNSVAVAEKG